MDSEERLARSVWQAACGEADWQEVLGALARSVNARCGHIAPLDPLSGLSTSVFYGLSAADVADFVGRRAYHPSVNPRVAAGLAAIPGRCITDDDFLTPRMKRDHPLFRDLFRATGTSQSLMIRTPTDGAGEPGMALAFLRCEAGGPATAAERDRLERLAPAIGSAAAIATRFGARARDAVLAALDSRGDAVFALDLNRRPVATNELAEAILRDGAYLRLRSGTLRATHRSSDGALADAVGRAAGFACGGRTTARIVLRHPDEAMPAVVARISPVPDRLGPFSSTCALLLLPRAVEDEADTGAVLGALFGMTPAEASVALAIAAGLSPKRIAADRGLSPATIRTQLRAAMVKAGVGRQSALVAIVAAVRR